MSMIDLLRPRLQSLAGTLVSHRVLLYTLSSTVAISVVIANALQIHSNFYSVTVYLSKSSRSILVLANFSLLVALVIGRIVQQIFFGSLRPLEVERLYDRMWFFVTESLLAFTIFRDEFDIPFAIMFGFLLFVKSFHWLMADRVEWMDQMPYPGPPALFHVRINSLFVLLWITNFVMLGFAVESILANGVGAMVLFASEYAILMASALNAMAKYALSIWEFRRAAYRGGENAPPWENKSMWVFYVDLMTDFLKLTTYLTFFTFILTFYGMPLNVVRDIYVTARSFITRLRTLIRYHNATRNMDERYPNATEVEMAEMSDRTCIICREEMIVRDTLRDDEHRDHPDTSDTPRDGPNITPKKLPCGHIFHFHCLRSWLERQQSCPTCRRAVLGTDGQTSSGRAGRRGAARGAVPQPAGVPGNARPPVGQRGPPQPFGNLLRGLLGIPQPQPQPPQYIPVQYQQLAQHGGENFGWGPAPPPPQGYAYPQAPHQLHPPPMFQGFYGPGGQWHPWGIDDRWPAPVPQEHNTPDNTPPPPIISTDGHLSTTPPPSEQPSSSSGLATHPTGESSTESRSSTPRDAAALAALRRMGKSSSSTNQTSVSHEASDRSRHEPFDSNRSISSESPPSSTEAISTPDGPAGLPNGVPSLIPVYSLTQPHYMPPPPMIETNHGPSWHHHNTAGRPILPNSLRPTPPPSYQQQNDSRSRGQDTAPADHPSMSTLPPTLTEDQLTRLDRLTRDAIDERLRVLEGVSGAVYRCIEELTRVRSVLPPVPAQGTGVSLVSSNRQASSSGSSGASASSATSEPLSRTTRDDDAAHSVRVSDDAVRDASVGSESVGLPSAA